jgi:ABC-type spermidine/putrescine transport system permease subunit I
MHGALVTGRGLAPPAAGWALLLPALALLVVGLLVPLAATAWLSLLPNVLVSFDGPALENYRYLFGKGYYFDAILRTLRIAFKVTLVSLAVGYLTALALKGMAERIGATMIVGLTFPILAGPLIIVLGWMMLLADGGPVLRHLVQAGWIAPLRLIGTETAVVIGLVHFTLPFVVLTLYASLRQIPEDLAEAARSLGARPWQVFRRITWPLSLPGVLSAALIAFSLAASAYVSPHYLGGAVQLVLTTLVGQFILVTFNGQMAAAAAMLLLVIMVVIVFVFTRLVSRLIR